MNEQANNILLEAMQKPDQMAALRFYVEETSKIDEQLLQGLEDKDKTYEKCWTYIQSKAKEHLKSTSGHVMPSIVFGWAIHYFTESSDALEKEFGKLKSNPVVKETKKPTEENKKQKKAKASKKPTEENKSKFHAISMFDILDEGDDSSDTK